MKKFFTPIILLIFGQVLLLAQYSNLKFERFKTEDGVLPVAPSICQDKTGYLWIGTFWGIARYDGYSFKAYRPAEKDASVLNSSVVEEICADENGIIWLGHTMGLDKFDPVTETFKNYILNPSMPLSDWSNHVLALCNDRKGNLWIGTGNGLYLFDKKKETFKRFIHDSTDAGSIIHNSVNAIYEDKSGNVWFGTGGGLDKQDNMGKFIHYFNVMEKSSNWDGSPLWVLSIFEDEDGTIWLGASGALVEFNRNDESFTLYQNNPKNSESLGGYAVISINQDKNGFFWLATNGGLDIFDKRTKKFTHHRYNESDPASLSVNEISQVFMESSGTVWITSWGGGVNKCIPPNSFVKEYSTEVYGMLPDAENNLAEDMEGKIWVATNRGLISFDPDKEILKKENFNLNVETLNIDESGTLWVSCGKNNFFYKRNNENVFRKFQSKKIFGEDISGMQNSKDGNMWLGTVNGHVLKLNIKTGQIEKKLKYDAGITLILEDKHGLLWLGTYGAGVICYNNETKKSTVFTSDPKDSMTLSGNEIWNFCEDGAGNFWLLTRAHLHKFDYGAQKFTRNVQKDGFAGSGFSMLADEYGNVWVNMGSWVDKYDPIKKQHQIYKNLELGHIYKTRKGEFYILTTTYNKEKQKMLRVNPEYMQNNSFVPPIVITSFKKFEKPSMFGKEVRLNHNENFISFEFSALSFIKPNENKYAYKMEGVDKDWIYSETRRYASYPNLDPGEYVFKVKGSNNDGVWNEVGTSIAIIISPPWWKTWWAYSSYALIFAFTLYGIRRYEMNRLKLKDKIKLDEAVLKEKEETDKMKSSFFANISHEFRTPLTLILGPAEKISSKTSDDVIKDANIIQRNSRRLLQLVNQLLDLSKLEAGKIKLEVSKGNIVSFVKGVALSFESLAESKDISLKINSEKDFIEMYFDKEKMMKILTNILSNAFKFTAEEGIISVSIKENKLSSVISRESSTEKTLSTNKEIPKQVRDDNVVEIKIRDTGIGITQEEIPKLFDRFYQVDSSHTREYEGTGIGLALTKELVELHHGRISVESDKGVPEKIGTGYTEFTLQFPLGREHLSEGLLSEKDEEIIKEKATDSAVILNPDKVGMKNLQEEPVNQYFRTDSSSSVSNRTPQNDVEANGDKTIILVVEDNYDMRQYIRESLDGNYLIEEAVNGEQGVRKAEKIIPDLIISDMMMPKMDGNELVRILKNDAKTSHIPIILLTAKAGQENKLEGLEIGADDYLTKPFDIKELQVRIKNLITIRKKLQEKFSKIEFKPSKVEGKKLSSLDEKFMFRVNEIIEKHISEEEFNMEGFGDELFMSRMQVHRKLKALTGKSANRYMRSFKLQKARKMIEEKQGNISEIAYSLGFNTPAYFTKCFKDEFGYPPSEIEV
jgi:signal transduction histidine kinase/ligand-binding sensor domain-containing protein/DNA-binding response OmpR family regulator